jgi:AmmeMemoRadiSam system protein B/AmmeMemoRadiSam system protein A
VPGWVREPAVAGLFYPGDPDELRAAVVRHLGGAAGAPEPTPDAGSAAAPRALIAPHAGYRYSGATAGLAYRAAAARREAVGRVVLVGPAHRHAVGGVGVGVSSARAWVTPLGEIPVDVDACGDLVAAGAAVVADEAHAGEHSLEVQLPFVLEALGPLPVVPLVAGGCPASAVAAALDLVWDEAALVVVSSDLSHYLPEDEARVRDERTRRAIIEGRSGDIGPYDACGSTGIAGLLVAASRRDVVPRTLGMTTSAEASGDRSRVVGYGSFAFAPPRPLREDEQAWLLPRARAAIAHEFRTRTADPLADEDVPERLRVPGASFVTLEHAGNLVGCIGSLSPTRPLWCDVAINARGAAFADPRFDGLTPGELQRVAVTVSVLSPMEPLPSARDVLVAALRPGADGVLVEADGRRGTFLPAVWDKLPEPEDFLRALLAKADIPTDAWPPGMRAWRFTTDTFTG